jgi:hypothetical protein
VQVVPPAQQQQLSGRPPEIGAAMWQCSTWIWSYGAGTHEGTVDSASTKKANIIKMTTSSVAGLVTIGLLLIGIETALAKGWGWYFAKGNPGGLQWSSSYQQLEKKNKYEYLIFALERKPGASGDL